MFKLGLSMSEYFGFCSFTLLTILSTALDLSSFCLFPGNLTRKCDAAKCHIINYVQNPFQIQSLLLAPLLKTENHCGLFPGRLILPPYIRLLACQLPSMKTWPEISSSVRHSLLTYYQNAHNIQLIP